MKNIAKQILIFTMIVLGATGAWAQTLSDEQPQQTNGSWTFTMPAGNRTLRTTWKQEIGLAWKLGGQDVPQGGVTGYLGFENAVTFPELDVLSDFENGIHYGSSQTTVATIDEDDGTVTFVHAGTTIIYAVYNDNDYYDSVYYTLTVEDPYTLTLGVNNSDWGSVAPILTDTIKLDTLEHDITVQQGVTLTGTLRTVNRPKKISIADGATVTLDGANINEQGYWPYGSYEENYYFAGITCLGDATIILADGSTNTVIGYSIEYPGIYVPVGKTLTIQGSTGQLNASCNNKNSYPNGYAAGIGGGIHLNCGNIVIQGGIITATAGVTGGAGIGSGDLASCGDITITGGTINAIGGSGSAGIGTASGGHCGAITITNGVTSVTAAKGSEDSGFDYNSIGKGIDNAEEPSTCGTVTIGGTIYWDGTTYQNDGNNTSTGIVQDSYTYNGNGTGNPVSNPLPSNMLATSTSGVYLVCPNTDVTVRATPKELYYMKNWNNEEDLNSNIAVNKTFTVNETMTQTANFKAYPILTLDVNNSEWGNVYLQGQVGTIDLSTVTGDIIVPDGYTLTGSQETDQNRKVSIAADAIVTIDNVNINADFTNYSNSLGGLSCEGNATIILKGSSYIQGYYSRPGIYVPQNSTLTIQGSGELTAKGGYNGAGIGAGPGNSCGNIVIKSGTIHAQGKRGGAAGIGSVGTGYCGDITITGGTITAEGDNYEYGGAGIGSGHNSSCGDITITGGHVTATKGPEAPNSIGNGSGTATCGTVTIGGTVYWDGTTYQNDGNNTSTGIVQDIYTYNGSNNSTTPLTHVIDNGNGTYSVSYGAEVIVKAVANPLHFVSGWEDELQHTLATATYSNYAVTNPNKFPALSSLTFTVTGDTTAKALFGINDYVVSASVADGQSERGTVKIDYTDGNNQAQTTVTTATVTSVQATALGGSSTIVTATPATGYHFTNWNGNVTTNPCTTSVAASYTASFDTNVYVLTVVSANLTMGGVSGGTDNAKHFREYTISATPNPGYHFDHWNDNNTDNPRIVTLTENTTYTAYFAENPTLTLVADGDGTVTLATLPDGVLSIVNDNPQSGSESYSVPPGTQVTVTATPAEHHYMQKWTVGNNVNTKNSNAAVDTTFIVTETMTLTATFAAKPTLTLVADPTDGGRVEVDGVVSSTSPWSTKIFNYCWDFHREAGVLPRKVTSPYTISNFNNPFNGETTSAGPWKVEYVGEYSTDNSSEFDHEGVYTIQQTYGNGIQSFPKFQLYQWNSTNQEYVLSGVGTIYAYANEDNSADHAAFFVFSEGNELLLTGNSYTNSVDLSITFDEDLSDGVPTIVGATTTGLPAGVVEGNAANEYIVDYGTEVAVKALPNTGYHFDSWNPVHNLNDDDTAHVTVTSNTTLTANFAINTYTVTIVSNNESFGTVSQGSVLNVPYGTNITVDGNTLSVNGTTVTATPATNTAQYTYDFSNWSDVPQTVIGNVTITANFTQTLNTYTVTIVPNEGAYGTVNPTSVLNVPYGTTITSSDNTLSVNTATATTVTATPATNTAQYTYAFSDWSDVPQSVTGNVTITANFTQTLNSYTVTIVANNDAYGTVNPTSVASVPYGTTITSSGNTLSVNGTTVTATPATNTAQYTYDFSNWSNVPLTVTGDVTITANFTRTLNTYTVTIVANEGAYGTVNPTSVLNVPYGTAVTTSGNTLSVNGTTVTATPATNTAQYTYDFSNWSDVPQNVTGNVTIKANFTQTLNTYTLTLATNGSGSVTLPNPLPDGVTGSNGTYTVNYGTQVTVTATPAEHHYMKNWNNEADLNSNVPVNKTVTVNANTTLTAYFAQKPILTLTTNPSNPTRGTVTIAGTTPPNSAEQIGTSSSYYVNYGASVTVVATPDPHYHLASWGNTSGNELQQVVTLTSDMEITGVFAIDTFTLTLKTNDIAMGKAEVTNHSGNPAIVSHGTDANGTSTYKVNYGAEVIIKATPENHYHLESWSNGATVNPEDTIHVNVTKDSTVTANFAINTYTIAATVSPVNSGTVNGAGTYNHGATVTLTATPTTGYHFVNWTNAAGTVLGTETSLTVQALRDSVITANFDTNTYALNVQSVDAAMGSVSGSNPAAKHFLSYEISATANEGYHFVQWQDGNSDNPRTVTLTQAATYTASFDTNTYALNVQSTDVAMGSVSGGNPAVKHFLSYEISATPNNGCHFVQWNDGNTDNPRTVTLSSDSTFTATFAATPAELAWSSNDFTGYTYIDFNNWKPTLTNPHNVSVRYGCVEGNQSLYGGILCDAQTGTIGASSSVYGYIHGVAGTYHIYAVHETDQTYYYDSVVYTLHVLPSAEVGLTKNIDEGGVVSMPDYTDESTLTNLYITVNGTPFAYVAQGYSVRILAEPATGYHFGKWTLSQSDLSSNAAYTYQAPATITGNLLIQRIQAVFDTNTYALNVQSTDVAMGSVSGSNPAAKHFLSYEISATANEGYHFVQWQDGNSDNPRTVTLSSDSTFTANFDTLTYALTVVVADGQSGWGSVAGSTTAKHFKSYQISATANEGYHFVQWNDGNSDNPRTVTLTQAATYTATFAINTYTLTLATNGSGSVTLPNPLPAGVTGSNGTYTVNYGTNITVTATPATHHYMQKWDDEDPINSNVAVSKTVTVNANTTLTAYFAQKPILTLTTNPSDPIRGYVTIAGTTLPNYVAQIGTSSSYYVDYDSSVTVKATPIDHYHLASWNNTSGNALQQVVTMTADMEITGVFAIDTFTLTLKTNDIAMGKAEVTNHSDNPAIVSHDPDANGTRTYKVNYGAEVIIKAFPKDHYHLESWSNGATVNPEDTIHVIVTDNSTITANFAINTYTIAATVNPTEGGTVSGAGSYTHGASCTLTATPATGYHFVNWTDGNEVVSTNATYAFTVNGTRSLVANFSLNTYAITANANPTEGGTVSGADSYTHGATATLTASANVGYTFVNWTENDTVVANAGAEYTFTVTGARNLMANFAINTYTLTLAADGDGTVTLDGLNIETFNNLHSGQSDYTGENIKLHVDNPLDGGFQIWHNNFMIYYYYTATITSLNGENITKVELTRGSTSCYQGFYNDLDRLTVNHGTLSVNGDMATITGINASSLTIGAQLQTDIRIGKVKVYYGTPPEGITEYTENNAIVANKYNVAHGTALTVKATAAQLHHVAGWSDEEQNNLSAVATYSDYAVTNPDRFPAKSSINVTVTGDTTMMATFGINSYEVNASVANTTDVRGTVKIDYTDANNQPQTTGAAATVQATALGGSTTTLIAIPAAGYHFVNWTNGNAVLGTNDTLTTTEALTAIANFDTTHANLAWSAEEFTGYVAIDFNNWKPTLTNPHSVNVRYGCVEGNDPNNGGIVVDATTGIIGNETNFGHATLKSGTFHIYAVHETDQNYYYDSVVYTLHVLPSAFVGLSPNIASAGTLSMPNATNVPSLTHHYATVGNLPTVIMALNESVDILAEPATGYHFNYWQIPLVPQEEATTAAYTYQFTIPIAVNFQINLLTRTLRAIFDTNTYALNVVSANLEMGSGNGGNLAAKHFLNYEISASPNTGYHFVKWNDGNTANPRTVTLISDSTFTAIFAPDTFTITYMDGETELNVDTFYYHQPITDYTVSKVGWDFLGWSPEVPEVMPAGNLTVYAQWYRICDPVTDIDNNTYPSVNINNKCWMAANLRTTHYADGRDITNLYEYTSFLYPSTAENVSIYGRLYDWYDAMDATRPAKAVRVQGICPDGWFMPTQDDFAALDTTDLQNLRSTNFWVVNDGNNSTGLDMKGSGLYNIDDARYEELLCKAYFWTANGTSATEAHCREASYFCNTFLDLIRNKENAFSVRCVKD